MPLCLVAQQGEVRQALSSRTTLTTLSGIYIKRFWTMTHSKNTFTVMNHDLVIYLFIHPK